MVKANTRFGLHLGSLKLLAIIICEIILSSEQLEDVNVIILALLMIECFAYLMSKDNPSVQGLTKSFLYKVNDKPATVAANSGRRLLSCCIL